MQILVDIEEQEENDDSLEKAVAVLNGVDYGFLVQLRSTKFCRSDHLITRITWLARAAFTQIKIKLLVIWEEKTNEWMSEVTFCPCVAFKTVFDMLPACFVQCCACRP